jgi:hypothetical protein
MGRGVFSLILASFVMQCFHDQKKREIKDATFHVQYQYEHLFRFLEAEAQRTELMQIPIFHPVTVSSSM